METRTITEVRIYVLGLNPMRGGAEERRVVALSTDYDRLVAWYHNQMVPEWRDGLWRKYFRAGTPLEWYNPAPRLELNQHAPYGHGIGDVWMAMSNWSALQRCGYYAIIE